MKCRGKETVKAAAETKNLEKAMVVVSKHGKSKQGKLTEVFQKMVASGKEVYPHIPLTRAEGRYVLSLKHDLHV